MTALAIPAPRQPAALPVPAIPRPRTSPEAARTTAEILADAAPVHCGRCFSGPFRPCRDDATHIVRLNLARKHGLITGADYVTVLLDPRTAFGAGIVLPSGGAS